MRFFPKPTPRGLIPLAIVLTCFSRWDPSTPSIVQQRPQPVTATGVSLSAGEVLANMAAAYARCSSYEDSGVAWVEFSGWPGHVSGTWFRTSFVRGGGFRFEYEEENTESLFDRLRSPKRMVIWGDNHRAQCWWTVGGLSADTLNMEIAGATGVSDGTAHTIPRMLLPMHITGRSLSDLGDATLASIESIEGSPCFRIEGKYADQRLTIWVDTANYLLRRTLSRDVLEGGTEVVETTVYAPRLNVEIDPAAFAFEPPG